MDEISFISSKSNLWKKGGGILVTLITLAIIEIAAWTWIRIPNPPPVLLLAVVFSTFVGGLRQGLISAVITWLYTFYHFSIPGQLFHYTDESFLHIIVLTGVIPAMAILVGILKRRADRVAEVSKTSAILQAKLTEDQKLGEAIQERERRLHIALEAANAGAWEWDIKTNKVFWSDENYRVLGIEPGSIEASHENWINGVHPEDREYANLEVSKSIEKKQKLDIEFRIIKPDGSICWINDRGELAFDENGEPVKMYGIQIDITERKRAEEALLEKEHLLSESQRIAHVGSWSWNLRGSIDWTDETYRIYGVSPETFTPTIESLVNLLHPEDRPAMQRWLEACRAGQSPDDLEFRVILHDGSVSLLSGRGELIYDTENRPAYMAGTVQDITERKRAEEALRESEERFKAIASNTPDHILMQDRDLRYVFVVNPQLGLTEKEMIGKTDYDFLSKEEADNLTLLKRQVLETGKTFNFETSLISRKGKPEFFDGTYVPTFDTQGRVEGLIGYFRNVTEQKLAEIERQESEQQLRLFVEHSPAAIAMFNRDMKYIIASRRWLSDYGLGDRQIIGRSHYDVFPDLPERWKAIHQRCLAGAVEKCEEDPFPRADGHIDWVRWEIHPWRRADGEIGGIIIFSEVITERKKAEEEIRIANEELLAINRIITTTTTTTTGVKGILEKVLDEALRITGLEGGTVCMVTPDETLVLAVHRETSEATILDLTTNQIKIGECLCGECAKNHKPLILWDREAVLKFSSREAQRGEDIRFHAALPLITGGRCLGVLCVFTRTDKKPLERRLKLLETVTSQIAIALENARLYEETVNHAAIMEDRVKERTAELNESQRALMNLVEDLNIKSFEIEKANLRLQELDQLKSMFIASMSHELRTPLNSIIGFTGIILQGMSGEITGEQRKQLRMVQGSARHLLELINDIIDLSKIEAGKVELVIKEFDLSALVKEVKDSFNIAVTEKGLKMSMDIPESLIVRSDERRTRQVIMNLLSNAVKFTDKGFVRVNAQIISDFGIRISELEKGEHKSALRIPHSAIQISVSDTGSGIREEDMDKLFKPFSRILVEGMARQEGTGLGLYLSKKIADLLGGEIRAESEFGKGSRFIFKLPLMHVESP